jgi:hypothetical protein
LGAELDTPEADGFIADRDTSLGQKILTLAGYPELIMQPEQLADYVSQLNGSAGFERQQMMRDFHPQDQGNMLEVMRDIVRNGQGLHINTPGGLHGG